MSNQHTTKWLGKIDWKHSTILIKQPENAARVKSIFNGFIPK